MLSLLAASVFDPSDLLVILCDDTVLVLRTNEPLIV